MPLTKTKASRHPLIQVVASIEKQPSITQEALAGPAMLVLQ